MIFLPIVQRELCVAARKRSTFWVRIIAALVALVIGIGFLVLTMVGFFGFGTASLGKGLFTTLTWLSLAAVLSAGLFFTSDCLSEEKREGTIGFLFLTDLRGYDVALGKLLATSLRAFYALLAVFPILAVTLLMGGVTGAQFWKTALALVNALIVSLAAGLFVSALSRDSQKAMGATLFLLVLLVGGGPAGDAIFAAVKQRSFNPVLSLSSPGFLFVQASAWGKSPYWSGLLINQAVAWLLFGLTCLWLPRSWQERAAKTLPVGRSWTRWWKFGGIKRRVALRRKLLGVNPVLWLACRERWQAVFLWMVAILLVSGLMATFGMGEQSLWFVWSYLGGVLTLVLYLGIASQATRFFVEAQRSGLIELLLATPLTVNQIVQGQWRALLRMFGLPLVLCVVAQLFGSVLAQKAWSGVAAAAAPPATPTATVTTNTTATTVTNITVVRTAPATGASTTVSIGGLTAPSGVALVISLAGTLTFAANLAALIWFGMWMGLNSKNTNLATLKTIVFVQIIPWFVVTFASALVVPLVLLPRLMSGSRTAPTQMMVWFPLLN